ncbi:hypothetical protein V2J09_001995 [Rumex salicifolius]
MFRRKHRDENDSLLRDAKVKELRAALGPLSGRISKFCTDACLVRYLEARNWNGDKARKMLEDTIKWRTFYKPEEIRWNEVAHEGETGKVSRANFKDRLGRSVLILRPGKQNTTSAEGNIRHLVYMIENAILNLPEGQGHMSWLIDFTGWSMSTSVPVKTARETINILQNHYPERLGVAFLYNPPRIFEAFWKSPLRWLVLWQIVKYFLDDKTFQKVKFVHPNKKESLEVMKSHFDIENLPAEFGGNATLDYNHEEFSKLMIEDDAKSAAFWGFGEKSSKNEAASEFVFHSNVHSRAEVAPEPDSFP